MSGAGGAEGGPGIRVVADNAGLVATGLGKRYRKRPVVRNVSLTVRRGEAVGLLGPNGAGKTTTFYMITGLVQPDQGTVRMDGHDVTTLPMYRRARLGLGYLPQEASIFRGLSVEDNIRATLEVVEPLRHRREQMLDSLLAEFGIAHLRRARWPRSPPTSCSTSRWPASTPSPSARSATWSSISRTGGSAC